MMSYINETDFVIENKKLVYPEIVADGLQLYYDAKGKRDTDYHRDTMLDMSGNKNHGKLHNFAYEKHSGYKDGLVFDYIDDKLVRPALNLKPDDVTFMLNGNIISFSPDGTVKRVQDGEVVESKGFNMIRNGDFVDERNGWKIYNLKLISRENGIGKFETTSSETAFVHQPIDKNSFSENDLVYTSFDSYIPHSATSKYIRWFDYENITLSGGSSDSLTRWSGVFRTGKPHPEYGATIRHHAQGSPGTIIELGRYVFVNLTRTFGAGNEPTKEQMDEIIQRFGFIPNSQDLIDRIEYKGNDLGDMENIIDGLYKTEVLSGEEVYTDKADDDAGVHVDVDGKSVGGGENNLISKRDIENWNGTTEWNNDVLSIQATTTGGIRIPSSIFEKNQKYTLSFKAKLISGTVYGIMGHAQVFNTRGYQNGNSLGVWHGSVSSPQEVLVIGKEYNYKINLTRIADNDWLYIQPNRSSYHNPYKLELYNFQLNTGDNTIEYNGLSPSPDYPVEIHSLNDFDVVSSVGKENLLKDSQREWKSTREYIAPSYNLNEIFDKYPIGQTYTISFDAKSDDPSNKDSLQFYSNPGSTVQNKYMFATRQFTGLTTEYQRFSHTITPYLSADPSFPKSGMSFYGLYDTGNVPTIRNIKIELGTTATPYSVSPKDIVGSDNHTSIDKINLLLDEPLRSVGDVKDRLFRDTDGVWKIERNVGEYKVTGLEAWGLNANWSDSTKNTFEINAKDFISHNPLKPRFKKVTSNYFTGFRSSNPPINHFRIQENESGNYFTVSLSSEFIAKEGVAWRNWLKEKYAEGTPFTVLYEKDSNVEILTQSLQDKLNSLRSFENSNYVYTVLPNENNYISENLKPTLHAKFLYNNWYKEDRVINNLMIYNRALTNEEMLQNYKTIKRRWGM